MTKLHGKKKDWNVPRDSRLFSFRLNREPWIVISKKKRLNPCPSEQRILSCHIEKGKTEAFPRLTFVISSKIIRHDMSPQFISKL